MRFFILSNTQKSKYVLSKLSLGRLEGANPNLVKVVKRAIELTTQDFLVVESIRSKEQMMINYGKGRTAAQLAKFGIAASYAQPKLSKVTWLNNPFASNHASGKAVDLVPYPVDWNDLNKFRAIAVAMKQAAAELRVPLAWGGDWKSSKDYPHFELA
ncbi:peptidoglycan L-alanyl-D-glutamate endopeptidase CwlK [Acinetobacter calcoaceticus]|uniref:Peptidoglycan L-alanyl-D-glutamate endopeptidase CwlK n=1 Tax=Acinetobacter calcoaceticus TaxID=471 RepID=A0A4R1XDV2_ACICA|nr:peptidoglycan L-alanyl-D-glutamate endopeptidase CwlK [Acinetobacter calcoaceticus]